MDKVKRLFQFIWLIHKDVQSHEEVKALCWAAIQAVKEISHDAHLRIDSTNQYDNPIEYR